MKNNEVIATVCCMAAAVFIAGMHMRQRDFEGMFMWIAFAWIFRIALKP